MPDTVEIVTITEEEKKKLVSNAVATAASARNRTNRKAISYDGTTHGKGAKFNEIGGSLQRKKLAVLNSATSFGTTLEDTVLAIGESTMQLSDKLDSILGLKNERTYNGWRPRFEATTLPIPGNELAGFRLKRNVKIRGEVKSTNYIYLRAFSRSDGKAYTDGQEQQGTRETFISGILALKVVTYVGANINPSAEGAETACMNAQGLLTDYSKAYVRDWTDCTVDEKGLIRPKTPSEKKDYPMLAEGYKLSDIMRDPVVSELLDKIMTAIFSISYVIKPKREQESSGVRVRAIFADVVTATRDTKSHKKGDVIERLWDGVPRSGLPMPSAVFNRLQKLLKNKKGIIVRLPIETATDA